MNIKLKTKINTKMYAANVRTRLIWCYYLIAKCLDFINASFTAAESMYTLSVNAT
jgi:hypothetical protein